MGRTALSDVHIASSGIDGASDISVDDAAEASAVASAEMLIPMTP